MASTDAAALKGALVVAMCVVLLHSSMGQEPYPSPAPPSPVLDCGNSCMSSCTQRCQPISVAKVGKCKTTAELYDDCFKGCTSGCKGNSYARGSCDIDSSCSPSSCGNRCGRDCCRNCTATATADPDQFIKCKSSQAMVMMPCMSSCMNDCTNNCLNGSVPPAS